MDARFLAALALFAVPMLPAVGAHAGQVEAAHPCPDVSTLWGHGHDAGGERFFWLDTHEESVHGPAGTAYWAPPADADNRTFSLLLDPPLRFPTALDEEGTIRIDVVGRAESATGPVLPSPVQAVFGILLGTNEVPAEVKDALRAIRYEGAQNVGPADVTLEANLHVGGSVVATGQASGVNTQPDDTLGVPPSPSSVNGSLPDAPRDFPVDPPPVHPSGDRAPFRATFDMTSTATMWGPDKPIWLTITRSEPFAWDLLLGGEDGLRIDLPIVDHPFGPLCPDWVVPPVNVTVAAPAKVTAAPGGVVNVPVGLENPARVERTVRFAFAGGDYGVVRGVVDGAEDGTVAVRPYEHRAVSVEYRVAGHAVEDTHRITMHVSHDNTTLAFPTHVVVVRPDEVPGAPAPPDGGGHASASPGDDATPPLVETFDAADDGGASPGPAVLLVATALAVAFAAVRHRR